MLSKGFVITTPLTNIIQLMFKKPEIYSKLVWTYSDEDKSELWTGKMWEKLELLQKKVCPGKLLIYYRIIVLVFRWEILSNYWLF